MHAYVLCMCMCMCLFVLVCALFPSLFLSLRNLIKIDDNKRNKQCVYVLLCPRRGRVKEKRIDRNEQENSLAPLSHQRIWLLCAIQAPFALVYLFVRAFLCARSTSRYFAQDFCCIVEVHICFCSNHWL